MAELRITDTNSADDARGEVFGLEGNLYLPVVVAVLSGTGLWALLQFALHLPWPVALGLPGLPVAVVIAWILLLKHNRPAGYDRDQLEQWTGGGGFTLAARSQPEALDP